MAKIQCKMCGGEMQVPEGVCSGSCPYCGTLTTFPNVSSEELENLYNRAEHFRRINEYDKAVSAYEKIVEVNPDDAEAYWGLVISKFGIEYVDDPVSHERIPTCHRVHYESILADADYLNALEKAGSYEKGIYEAEAKRIAEIQRDILSISNNEQPFDVFICYKESDNYGRRTKDSVTAQEIYYQLTNAGYKVFFSRLTLESKLGQQYEPYIFAALNSAKVMLVIGSQKEYFDAVWVRNEWSRFLALMKKDRSKLLIPCYKDMDAYDIPEALSMFQAQDMGKIGFIQDLLHGIKKVADKQENASPATPTATPTNVGDTNSKDHPFLQRAKLFLETAEFESAKEYCEKLLDINPQNGWAYFYRLMAENQVTNEKLLVNIAGIDQQKTFQLAQRFADKKLQEILNRITDTLSKNERKAKIIQGEKRRRRRKILYITSAILGIIIIAVSLYFAFPYMRGYKLSWDGTVLVKVTDKDITEFTIPDGVTTIGFEAFYGCSSLTSVTIPDSVTSIESWAFKGCSRLTSITADPKWLSALPLKQLTSFTVADGVTTIDEGAFRGCSSLTSVTIPDSVTSIGDYAFFGCSSLTSVTIPDSVTSIGYCAFRGCSSLTSVTIPNSVTSIGNGAFSGCSILTSVTIPDSVTEIGRWAFEGCSSLISITIPDSVTSIGNRAFEGCSSLTSVSIPRNCEVKYNAFPYGCRVIRR